MDTHGVLLKLNQLIQPSVYFLTAQNKIAQYHTQNQVMKVNENIQIKYEKQLRLKINLL